jgi:ATP-binding cassette subfamily F protein uup
VVTSLLVLEGDGVVSEQAGGYSDWEARGGQLRSERLTAVVTTGAAAGAAAAGATASTAAPAQVQPAAADNTQKRKLSYKLQRELDSMPGVIEKLEQRQQALEASIAQPDFYQQDRAKVQQTMDELAAVQAEMEATFERWEELENEHL